MARREFRGPLRFCAPEMMHNLPGGRSPVMGSGADSPCQGEMARGRFAQSLVAPGEAQRSGFAGKRRSKGTNAVFAARRGRGGARERTQFSPPGGNGVEWTQGELARRDKRRWPGPLRRRAAMGKGTRRPQAAKSPAKTFRSGAPRSSRPTRMQEKDYFFPCPSRAAKLWLIRSCPSRAAKLWLIRSPELWMSWSMDWYKTG